MKLFALGIIAVLYSAPSLAEGAPHWQLLDDKSSIEWTATYGGKPVTGSFPAFTADITFDPAHLDTSKATIKFETAKIKSDDKDAAESLPTSDWFAAAKFPIATFEAMSFTQVKDDQFQAEGMLSVRDKSVKVTLPFTAKFYDDNSASPLAHYARIQGETSVKRTAFGVGQGDWASTDTVADDVKIVIHLEAKQVP